MIEFDWDEANIAHIARHGVLPEEAEEAVRNGAVELAAGIEKGELRVTQIGNTAAERILVVVITMRGSKMRVVTSYPAARRLRRLYLEQKGGMSNEGIRNAPFCE